MGMNWHDEVYPSMVQLHIWHVGGVEKKQAFVESISYNLQFSHEKWVFKKKTCIRRVVAYSLQFSHTIGFFSKKTCIRRVMSYGLQFSHQVGFSKTKQKKCALVE